MEAELKHLQKQHAEVERRLQGFDLPPSGMGVAHFLLAESEMIKRCNGKPRLNWAYESYQDLVLDLGSAREGRLDLPEWCDPMEAQQCYANSFDLAIHDDTLTYVEGYAFTRFMPVQHAWLEDQSGRIIDPTWAGLVEEEGETAWYFGVKFDAKFVLQRSEKTGWLSVLSSDWRSDAEVLRYGLVMNDDNIAIGMGEA